MLKRISILNYNNIQKLNFKDSFTGIGNKSASFNFNKLNKRFYNGLFERPTQSLFSQIQIIGIIESLKYFKLEFDFSWTVSIIITSSLIRLIQIPTYMLIKDLKIKDYLPKKITNLASKWSHRLIYNDLYIDIKRNKIDDYDKNKMIKYYDLNVIFSYLPQFILLFNNFRALNAMSKSEEDQLYSNFTNDMGCFNLATYDSYFILPVIIFINNFFLLKVSNHPWLINYTRGNGMKLIYMSFMMSLFSVFWPKCYCISWISYSVTHIIIKLISKLYFDRKKRITSYSNHMEKNYKNKMEKWYNNKLIK